MLSRVLEGGFRVRVGVSGSATRPLLSGIYVKDILYSSALTTQI
jgi:hypothetical protein